MPNEAYFADPGINRGFLWDVYNSSIAHALANQRNRKTTTALRFGQALHSYVMERDKFSSEFAIVSKKTNLPEGQISEVEYETIVGMDAAIREHPIADVLFSEGEAEKVFFGEIDGLRIKVCCDWVRPDRLIVDLKSTEDASEEEFCKSSWEHGYHFQAALYTDILEQNGINPEAFLFVAVEKKDPFAVQVFQIDSDFLDIGRTQYKHALNIVAQYKKDGIISAYSEEIKLLSAPRWAKIKHLARHS